MLRAYRNSLICDVNLIIFGGKLIKLRRKFNNLRRKLKNYSALAAKLLRTRKVFTPHSQQNFRALAAKLLQDCSQVFVSSQQNLSALAAKHNQARAILNIESDVQLSPPSFITSITQNKSICAFFAFSIMYFRINSLILQPNRCGMPTDPHGRHPNDRPTHYYIYKDKSLNSN